MILLSNCLTDVPDEGCLKVANSLAKRIKKADKTVLFLSTTRRSVLTDVYMEINKMLLSSRLVHLLRRKKETVLYIPFPTRSLPNAVRIFWLSCVAPKDVRVIMTMTHPYNWIGKMLMRMCKAHIYALSKEAADFYTQMLGVHRVTYLRTGVDTQRFVSVPLETSQQLKIKYGLDPQRKVVLHVGHLKAGRNIAELMKLDESYQILLVVSTFTQSSEDEQLRRKLEAKENVKIIDTYLPEIQEIYQLADVYFFPVVEQGNCIDVPLSCLEAASCGVPVVMTKYGEMREFIGRPGFCILENMEAATMNELVVQALAARRGVSRESVLQYDWNHAVTQLLR